MSSGKAMLEVRELTKRYRGAEAPALDTLDLSLGRGEVVGVVGRSGSGKTTLLRLVAGLEVPTSGRIVVAGRRVSGDGAWVAPEERPSGMLFQDGALFPHLSVARNVEFGIRRRPSAERGARRDEVLELVGLGGHQGRYPHQLSGGERRRVALARALAPGPELLLLDEPFTGLDADLTARLAEEVAGILRETGTTALVVLHDTYEVLPLVDRIAVLRDGRLAQLDAPERVYARPDSEYVARLFGPANVVRGLRRGGELVTPVGAVPAPSAADGGEGGEEEVRVVFRPEDFVLDDPASGAVTGTVVRVAFRGDRREARVRVEDDGEAWTLTIQVPVERSLRPGERLDLRPRHGRGHVLGPAARTGGSATG